MAGHGFAQHTVSSTAATYLLGASSPSKRTHGDAGKSIRVDRENQGRSVVVPKGEEIFVVVRGNLCRIYFNWFVASEVTRCLSIVSS